MLALGVDVGARYTKVALWDGARVLAFAIGDTGLDIKHTADVLTDRVLGEAQASRSEVRQVGVTGSGRHEVPWSGGSFVDVECLAAGAARLAPSARTIIDVGFEESRVVIPDQEGKVARYRKNDKCGAGTGVFIETVAKIMWVPVEDMGPLSLPSTSGEEIALNTTCAVFAESDIISALHGGASKAAIARAVVQAVANKTATIVRAAGGPIGDVVLVGGVAKISGFVGCLQELLEVDFLPFDNPHMLSALGAALLAEKNVKERSAV